MSNVVLYGGTSISHSFAGYGDTEGPGYAAQIHHIAGHSVNSSTPGTAFLFLADRQWQGESCLWSGEYLISFDSPAGSSQSGTNIDPAIVVAVVLFLGLLTFAQINFYLFKRKREV